MELLQQAAAIGEAVCGVEIVYFFFPHSTLENYYLCYLPLPFIAAILSKCPMTLLTAMNANQQVTKTIFCVDCRNSSHNGKPEFVLKTKVTVS